MEADRVVAMPWLPLSPTVRPWATLSHLGSATAWRCEDQHEAAPDPASTEACRCCARSRHSECLLPSSPDAPCLPDADHTLTSRTPPSLLGPCHSHTQLSSCRAWDLGWQHSPTTCSISEFLGSKACWAHRSGRPWHPLEGLVTILAPQTHDPARARHIPEATFG